MNAYIEKLEEETNTHIFRVFPGTSKEISGSNRIIDVTRLESESESEDDDELNEEENLAVHRLSVGTIVRINKQTYIQIDD